MADPPYPWNARHKLVSAHLRPRPLYPTRLPRRLLDPDRILKAQVSISHRRRFFTVSYTRLQSPGPLAAIVDFSRESRRSLRDSLRVARLRGDRVRRTRLRGRRVYSFTTDIYFGYMWREQGFTYYARAHCCLASHIRRRDLRLMVTSAKRLGFEYRGRTSQNKRIDVYRSSAGIEYRIRSVLGGASCNVGPLMPTDGPGRILRLSPTGAFSDVRETVEPNEFSDEDHYRIALHGTASSSKASGTWAATDQGEDLGGTAYQCATGPVTWSASHLP